MTERKHPHISDEALALAWPCRACGALEPDRETGHDPCIKNLPGVQYACCGHGRGEGYVMFDGDDRRVLRGAFDHAPAGAARTYAIFDPPFTFGDVLDLVRAMWGRWRAETIKVTWPPETVSQMLDGLELEEIEFEFHDDEPA